MTNIQEEITAFMQKIQALGYAVVVFTPEELRGTSADEIEYHMMIKANDMINYLTDEENDQ